MSIYNSTIGELCNTAITTTDMDGHKLTCAHTQNRTLFKMLDFCKFGQFTKQTCSILATHVCLLLDIP